MRSSGVFTTWVVLLALYTTIVCCSSDKADRLEQEYVDTVILHSERTFHGSGRWLQDREISASCPTADCIWTTDASRKESAHASLVYVGVYGHRDLPQRHKISTPLSTRNESLLIGFEGEPFHKHPHFWQNTEKVESLDFLVSWQLTASVPCIMCEYNELDDLRTLPLPAAKQRSDVLISAFISNPRNERFQVLRRLQEHIDIDVYGNLPGALPGPHGKEGKLSTIRQYRFHLSWENDNVTDYVSEKLTDAWRAGTIPIYMGAPNIDQFIPHPKSIIKASDWDNPRSLAMYIQQVHDDEAMYQSYFEWKKLPLSYQFMETRKFCWDDCIVCRTCELVAREFNISRVDEGMKPKAQEQVPNTPLLASTVANDGIVYIVLTCCGRHEILKETVSALPLDRDVLIFEDGSHPETPALLTQHPRLTHKQWHFPVESPEAALKGPARISKLYKAAVETALQQYPDAAFFVFIEDDLLISPDAPDYLTAMAEAMSRDRTLFCASLWNDNSYPQVTSRVQLAVQEHGDDGAGSSVPLTERTDYFPGLGFMLKRHTLEQDLLPSWPNYVWDVYFFIRMSQMGQQCVHPVLSLVLHQGTATGYKPDAYAAKFGNLQYSKPGVGPFSLSTWQREASYTVHPSHGHRQHWMLARAIHLADWKELPAQQERGGRFKACLGSDDWNTLPTIADIDKHPRGHQPRYTTTLYGHTVHLLLARFHPEQCQDAPRLAAPEPSWLRDYDDDIPGFLTLTPGGLGHSCQQVCSQNGARCDASSAAYTLSSKQLRDAFGCSDVVSEVSELGSAATSGFVERFAQCYTASLRQFSCTRPHVLVAPLCPCIAKSDPDTES